jgi:hypothetical protein
MRPHSKALTTRAHTNPSTLEDALDARNSGAGSLIQANRIVCTVIQLGRVRQFGLPGAPLDHTAPPRTRPGGQRRGKCAPTYGVCRCRQHLQPVQAPPRQMALTIQAAKERALAIFDNLGRCQVSVRISLGIVVGGHFVAFAVLLVQPKPLASCRIA